jgi:NADH:ubiquinone oxidoreductase subunit 5 (subunit L)/multisubunit Na+/H+ antiporter MnhA subunit
MPNVRKSVALTYPETRGLLRLSVGVTFTFITFLIISPNVISILLGWDGLGLVSYFPLIYYQNVKSYGAGMLIVLSNLIGDVALFIDLLGQLILVFGVLFNIRNFCQVLLRWS